MRWGAEAPKNLTTDPADDADHTDDKMVEFSMISVHQCNQWWD